MRRIVRHDALKEQRGSDRALHAAAGYINVAAPIAHKAGNIPQTVVFIQRVTGVDLIANRGLYLLGRQAAIVKQKGIQVTLPIHAEAFELIHQMKADQQIKERPLIHKGNNLRSVIEQIFLFGQLLSVANVQQPAHSQRELIRLQMIQFYQKDTPNISGTA